MNIFQDYLKNIEQGLRSRQATEHTYRPALKTLIEAFSPGIIAINEPKRIQCGAPDYLLKEGNETKGYIEAKNIGVSLSKAAKSEQLSRYFNGLGNLILTDYLEFRWYMGEELRLTAKIATVDQKNNCLKVKDEEIEKLCQLFRQFLQANTPQINTPKELAQRMANIAQLIQTAIVQALIDKDKGGMLRGQLESFQKILLPSLTGEQFADMYAQTICYGLFAARYNCSDAKDFSLDSAARNLPKTNPFLRDIFYKIAGPDLDDRIVWAVEDLADILRLTDMGTILKDFGKRSRKEDPVVHFYETFLAAYNPKMRESRGVYYTPEPVVSYIVRSVDYLLKSKFNISKGLADASKVKVKDEEGQEERELHKVLILDPAVGTGTFMYGVIKQIYGAFENNKGMWSSYVEKHLLPRLFGFELLMAPYTVAHMKLGLLLQELGYNFSSEERLQVYLTNTLQDAFQIPPADGFTDRICEEAEAAKEVKENAPVMVILGNPPYSGHSVNKGNWIKNLLRGTDILSSMATESYFEVDGKPLGERNSKWLNDDYVKFIRFSQWRIEKTGHGILAFITNHGYLDNPTFRGMRESLLKTFDEIYVLDLHGNSKKKEVCPDGSPDKNVFDIQQGVAIGIFAKYPHQNQNNAMVYHADLWGKREQYQDKELTGGKYFWLSENDLSSTDWEIIDPKADSYLFQPQNIDLLKEYEKYWKVVDFMKINSIGVCTARDKFAIQFTDKEVWKIVTEFSNLNIEDARIQYNLGKDTRDWQIKLAQKDLQQSNLSQDKIVSISYRPFDSRYTYYTGNSRGFHCMPRSEVMNHLLSGGNLALTTLRRPRNRIVDNFFVSETITDKCIISSLDNANIFPLYLYKTQDSLDFDPEYKKTRSQRDANLSLEFRQDFCQRLNLEYIPDGKGNRKNNIAPEDIFSYMYAVFHSPTYRQRYAEFLKIDFPRLPLTSNQTLFFHLCEIGDRLVNLHLMKENAPEMSSYPVEGTNIIEKIRYAKPTDKNPQGRVYINKTQYFANVPPKIWNFYVGGYQVCQKWLKDRQGRELTFDDLSHYHSIVAALAETQNLMVQIDRAIAKYGGFPIT